MIGIFRLLVPASVLALLLSETGIIFACYGVVAYFDPDLGTAFLWDQDGWQRIALVAMVIVLGMYFRQLYGDLQIRSRILVLQQLVLVMGMTFLVEALLSYGNLGWALPRTVLIGGSALTIGALFLWRILFSLVIRNKVGLRRILFMGLSPAALELAHYLNRHPEMGFAPIGFLDSGRPLDLSPGGAALFAGQSDLALLGSSASLLSVVEEHRPDWIVLARRAEAQVTQADAFAELHFGGVQTEDAACFYEKTLGRVCAGQVRPETLVFSEDLQPKPLNLRLQSMYSFVIALVAAPILLPLMAAVALYSAAKSRGGSVLLREARVGLHGIPFTMYRFRLPEDSPLARVGLHCLPELWNVLRGQMRFIGPQADRPEFAARLNQIIPFYAQRTAVRPGMTGWAQISQTRDDTVGDALRRLEYDMYYIKSITFLLDLFVLLRRLRDIFMGRPEPEV